MEDFASGGIYHGSVQSFHGKVLLGVINFGLCILGDWGVCSVRSIHGMGPHI